MLPNLGFHTSRVNDFLYGTLQNSYAYSNSNLIDFTFFSRSPWFIEETVLL